MFNNRKEYDEWVEENGYGRNISDKEEVLNCDTCDVTEKVDSCNPICIECISSLNSMNNM